MNDTTDLFYQFEKIRAAIGSKDQADPIFATRMLAIIRDTFNSIPNDQAEPYHLACLERSIERLNQYFTGDDNLTEHDANIYAQFIEDHYLKITRT